MAFWFGGVFSVSINSVIFEQLGLLSFLTHILRIVFWLTLDIAKPSKFFNPRLFNKTINQVIKATDRYSNLSDSRYRIIFLNHPNNIKIEKTIQGNHKNLNLQAMLF